MTATTYTEHKLSLRILVHASAWIVYASFIYIANFLANPNVLLLQTLLFLCPYCLSFYVSIYVLGLRKQKGAVWSIASFFIVFLLMSLVGYMYVYLLLPATGIKLYTSTHFRDFLKAALLGFVQYFSYAMLYFYIRESFLKERAMRKLEEEKLRKELENSVLKQQELQSQQEKLQLEYAFLRTQVNPHFLHNTLNVLFGQALPYSEELADNIDKLSRMMRYSLESIEQEGDTVPVEKELENLDLLLDMHRMRFGGTKYIDYSVEGLVSGQELPALSFITVVENAFKYGDLKDASQPLYIRVKLEPDTVCFTCRNKKRKNIVPTTSHHIGISNLRRRLSAAFEDRYVLTVKDEKEVYCFELYINCKL